MADSARSRRFGPAAPKIEEVAALSRRGDLIPLGDRPRTVNELLDVFLEKHGRTLDSLTVWEMTAQFRKARAEFGNRHPDSLSARSKSKTGGSTPARLASRRLPRFRQAITWGVDRGLVERNATDGIKNPRRNRHERREVTPFESWDEVDAAAEELDARYQAIPVFAVGTGSAPRNGSASTAPTSTERHGRSSVRRRFVGGELKDGGKTTRKRSPLCRFVSAS